MPDYNNIDLHKIARTVINQYGFGFVPTKLVIDEINALAKDITTAGLLAAANFTEAIK